MRGERVRFTVSADTEIVTANQWAADLDIELVGKYGDRVGEQVRDAQNLGHAAGVTIDIEADDNYGRRLVSADGTLAVRYDEQHHWWVAD